MPCVERFLEWPGDEQRKLLPHTPGRSRAVEAAGGLDWYRIIGDGLMVGSIGSAPAAGKGARGSLRMTPQKIAGRIPSGFPRAPAQHEGVDDESLPDAQRVAEPWLDLIGRKLIHSGELLRFVEEDVSVA